MTQAWSLPDYMMSEKAFHSRETLSLPWRGLLRWRSAYCYMVDLLFCVLCLPRVSKLQESRDLDCLVSWASLVPRAAAGTVNSCSINYCQMDACVSVEEIFMKTELPTLTWVWRLGKIYTGQRRGRVFQKDSSRGNKMG